MAKRKRFDAPCELTTNSDVIDALGGTNAVAELTGCTDGGVSAWRAAKFIPPRHFMLMFGRLLQMGFTASPSLWNQNEGPQQEASR